MKKVKKAVEKKKSLPARSPVAKKRPAPKKKPVARKEPPSKKRPVLKKRAPAAPKLGLVIGKVTHYFPKVQAAVVKLKNPLFVGDTIRVKGHTTDFTQGVGSIQIDHAVVESAKKKAEIGLRVDSRVRSGDVVYKI